MATVIENKFVRVTELYDPDRCQCSTSVGPCPYKALKGEIFCPMHSGGGIAHRQRKEKMRNYRLSQWSARVNEFSDNTEIKSLREEIGITRMMLEQIVTQCKTPLELVSNSGKIADITTRIEKLVSTCHRLELQNNQLLDRGAVLNISMSIVEIIGKYVTDDKSLDQIGSEIVSTIMKSQAIKALVTTENLAG